MKFRWIFSDKSVENSANLQYFRGTFWGKLRREVIGKSHQFCGNFLGKFRRKSIGSALI